MAMADHVACVCSSCNNEFCNISYVYYGECAMTWISVEDRLPEDSKFRKVKTRKGEILKRVAWTGIVKYWRESHAKKLDRVRRDITHWMPLPEPPEEQ